MKISTEEIIRVYTETRSSVETARRLGIVHQTVLNHLHRKGYPVGPEGGRRKPTFQEEVGRWAEATFPNSTAGSIADHLAEEMLELLGTDRVQMALQRALEIKPPSDNPAAESADCFLLLLSLAHRLNFDLLRATREKFEEVKTRRWEEDPESGYARHKEEVYLDPVEGMKALREAVAGAYDNVPDVADWVSRIRNGDDL